jgi:hypothetical protein
MAIGGAREGAGRKSQWRSPTKMIRIPEKYEAQIIDYAKRLDSESEFTFEQELQRRVDLILMRIQPSQRREAAKLYKKLLSFSE